MTNSGRFGFGMGAPGQREYATRESEFKRPQNWTGVLIAIRVTALLVVTLEIALIGRGLWDVLAFALAVAGLLWCAGTLRLEDESLSNVQRRLLGTRWQWVGFFAVMLAYIAWLNWRDAILFSNVYPFPWVWELTGDATGLALWLHWPALRFFGMNFPATTMQVGGFLVLARLLLIVGLPWALLSPLGDLTWRGRMEIIFPSVPNVMPRELHLPSIKTPLGWLGEAPTRTAPPRGVVIHTVNENSNGRTVRALRLEHLSDKQWATLSRMANDATACWQKSRPAGDGVPEGFTKKAWQETQELIKKHGFLEPDESGTLRPTPAFHEYLLKREWERV